MSSRLQLCARCLKAVLNLALIGCLMAAFAAAETPQCIQARALIKERFGGHADLHPKHTPCRIEADFNGDGAADSAFLVRLVKPPPQAKKIMIANPWSRDPGRMPGPGDLAIAIVFGGASPKEFLVGDKEMFSTPIW